MGLAGGLATNGQASGGGGTGTSAVSFGTAAARPAAAAGNSGTVYYATDTGEPTFSDGSAWHNIQSILPTTNGPQLGSNSSIAVKLGSLGINPVGGTKLQMAANIDLANAGNGIMIAEGANAKQGTATLTAGSVVVANTSVTTTSRIFLTSQADGGTPGFPRVSTRTAGTSFTITSSSGTDTSTVAYEIFEVG